MNKFLLDNKIEKRIFIVGCPRSGTTLLQTILMAHPKIISFPETHFFSYAFPSNKLKRFFTWPALNVQRSMKEFLNEINRLDLLDLYKIGLFNKSYSRPFISMLDKLAIDSNKYIWIEKTPKHLHHINEITKEISNVKFIHIIRNGKNNIASLYHARNKYSDTWAKGRIVKGKSLNRCINRWKKDIQISKLFLGKENHFHLFYEELISDTSRVILNLYKFLDLDTNNIFINNEKHNQVITNNEPWKKNNSKSIRKTKSKFNSILSDNQKKEVSNKINHIILEKEFEKVVKNVT